MNTLIVITGPTAVGKTALCLGIAKHYDIPIINADSRQIYNLSEADEVAALLRTDLEAAGNLL